MFAPEQPMRLDQLWTVMQGEKGDLETRSEEYARWTLPYICPTDNSEGTEQDKADVAIGPRLVNHLANKVVDTMFPHDRPFFTIALTPEMRGQLRKELGEDEEAGFAEAVRSETVAVEQAAMRKLRLTEYRPRAVEAVKHLIITGNSLIRRMPDGTRVVYGIKDYCMRRTIFGKPIELLLKDSKRFGSLPESIQREVRIGDKSYKDDTPVELYTHFKWDGGRWCMKQGVDSTEMAAIVKYKPVDVPFLSLVWNLSRGDHYGRGHVEDHTTAFHQVDVLTRASIDMFGIMADIHFFVDPASVLDVSELNKAPRGSYHQGRDGDISTPDIGTRLEVSAIQQYIQSLERELANAFLLNSSGVRDAERVTAEEIRFIALELESAFGGLYSRLALEWQQHEAEYAVSQINFDADLDTKVSTFEVVVTTGLETLSREGQLDNLRRALQDLQMLDTVPEDVRVTINNQKFASFIFTNHAVNFKEFLFTPEELAANNAAEMKQQRELLSMQAGAKVEEEAGKKAIAGE